MSELSLNGIIDVSVQLNPTVIYQRGFNTALLLGPKSENAGMEGEDIKFYQTLSALLEDFGNSTSVYKAAALYFGQEATPKGVFVGCMTSKTVEEEEVDETLVQAVTRLREANSEWYVCVPTDIVVAACSDSNLIVTSTYVEGAAPATIIAYTLTNQDTYETTIQAMSGGKFQRTIMMYDPLHQSGSANEGLTTIAAVVGYALGKNNQLSSTYTLAYKTIRGISATSALTALQLSNILNNNANVYVKQGYYYSLFRQGKMCSGDSFDEILYIDMLVDGLKTSLMSLLISSPKIPQTEDGISVLTAAMTTVLERFKAIGFIAEGVWNGATILALETGDTLPNGYLIQFKSIASQTANERASRMAPDCYVCVKLAGAIEHITISLAVDK